MATLRQVRRRIQSVKNTQQITRAMKMVAAARLRRAQERLVQSRPYSDLMMEVTGRLARRARPEMHALLNEREERRALLLVVTSDRGLCGAFNTNVIRRATTFIKEKMPILCSILIVGKKGNDFFKRTQYHIEKNYMDIFRNLQFSHAADIARYVTDLYKREEFDSVYLLYNSFKSAIQQIITLEKLLPIKPDSDVEPYSVDYLYEPSPHAILEDLLPKYIENHIFRALLESSAGEQGARMTAMDAATQNANEIIQSLTLHYNKARQAAITRELIEVVSGANALER